MSLNKRNNGILLHITSLPSKYGVGDFGDEAFAFIDFLKRSKVGFWQLLPLGPTGYGNSPYSSRSTFAGNEYLLSIDSLIDDGYLNTEDTKVFTNINEGYIDFNIVENLKKPLLFKAANNFIKMQKETDEFEKFISENAFFLDDYAIFMALVDHYYDARWYSIWDQAIAKREEKALEKVRKDFKTEILQYKVLQYLFFKQWFALKKYANKNGIQIIGDLPIFVAGDSVDSWSNIHLFKTDNNNNYTDVSGCPPDSFTSDGQRWGNPVYNWEVHKKNNYKWWIARIKQQLKLYDIIRIDHFRGFEAYWEIPSSHTTAKHGKWVKGPGQELFDAIREELGELPIIAEDLGFMTKEVEILRMNNKFPGMKIGIFGFSWDDNNNFNYSNIDLPTNYEENFIAYPGTHDNQTIRGWFNSLKIDKQKFMLELLCTDKDNFVWAFIKEIYSSKANIVITQMQDLLEKDDKSRMNIPSTCGPFNWSWQLKSNENLTNVENKLKLLNTYYKRVSF
jgi:4-alpha-glucanotransferase